jgi:hypothetical protein
MGVAWAAIPLSDDSVSVSLRVAPSFGVLPLSPAVK